MSIDQIRAAIAPLRDSLLKHPVYAAIDRPAALRTFLEHHVFAVWDFMSLLKALQRKICCVDVPWLPSGNASARLINEIVLGEESDEDGQGGFASHFELYHRAMTGFGASTSKIDGLLNQLRRGQTIDAALSAAQVGPAVSRFVGHTFKLIGTGDPCRLAAAFTFGREDLLPDVFQQIVDQLDRQTHGGLAEFKYYLRRHIDLDGDEHGPLATRLVAELCGDDTAKWQAARDAAIAALEARLDLWNGIHAAMVG